MIKNGSRNFNVCCWLARGALHLRSYVSENLINSIMMNYPNYLPQTRTSLREMQPQVTAAASKVMTPDPHPPV